MQKKEKVKLTVFTPTYNRRELLKRVYDSLINQTVNDFVWLIVDDGSTDDTKSLVQSWIDEGIIDIRYDYCENGGKMRAHNRGVILCDTELFVCLDSDDYLVTNAVECLLDTWDKASSDYENLLNSSNPKDMWGEDVSKKSLAGIVAHKGATKDRLLTQCDFPKGTNDFSRLYALYLNGFKGETTLMFKTKVLRDYMFPEIDGEKYVPEDYIYDKIDEVCVLAVLDKIITVCEIVAEGYTDSVARLKRENKRAWFMYYEQRARITPMSLLKFKYLGFMYLYATRCDEKISEDDFPFMQRLMGRIGCIILKISSKE